MRKIAMIAAVLVLVLAAASARDKIVSADQLPKPAKDFIATNFSGKTVQYVEHEFNEYEVYLSDRAETRTKDNGKWEGRSGASVSASAAAEITFKGNGEWEKIKSYGGIPAGVLPEAVASYVRNNFADAKIVEAERDWDGIELKLSNRMEVFFDKNGKYLGQKYDD